MKAKVDVSLQSGRGQPFLGEAALQKGNAGAKVGQAVHPAWDFLPTKDLRNDRETTHIQNNYCLICR